MRAPALMRAAPASMRAAPSRSGVAPMREPHSRPWGSAHGVPRSADEAKQLAEASYRHMARGFITGEGSCETDVKLRAGVKLDLTGLGQLFDGSYRAISVTHLYDSEHGARTEFRCNRPGIKPL